MSNNLENVSDIISLAGQIIDAVEADQINDKVFVLNRKSDNIGQPKSCVAGSKAVCKLIELLHEEQKSSLINQVKGCGPYLKLIKNFEPTDINVFFLNSEVEDKVKYDGVDIIHLKATTVESLLLNFDLPNCRAAYYCDGENTIFYVSLHCIYSILTGHYYLPLYLQEKGEFSKIYKNNFFECMEASSLLINTKGDKLFNKLQSRIEKYKERGYTCRYIKTDIILPWIRK